MKIGNLKKKYIYIYILFRKKNPQNYHGQLVPNLIFFFIQKEKKHKIIMAHECQIWYLVT